MKRVLSFILAIIIMATPSLSLASQPEVAEIHAIPIEYSSPPMIGTKSGPYFFHPTAIVIHNSGSFPYSSYDSADMWAGYRRYHMETVHPGVYPEWTGVYVAQQGYPDGLTYPDQTGINDIDYTWGIPVGADIAQGMGVLAGRDPKTLGWHAGGALPGMPEINTYSWGICFVGNFDLQPPDAAQYALGVQFVSQTMIDNKIRFDQLFGHKEIRGTTSCPGYYFPLAQFKEDVRMQIGGFYDVSYDAWYWSAVRTLTASGIVTGFADKNLYPDAMMTRAEFVNMLWKEAGSPTKVSSSFMDTSISWAYVPISWASSNNLVSGYPDGTFRPNQPITRAEVAAIIGRWKNVTTSIPEWSDAQSSWASGWIGGCALAGYILGYPDGTFKPNDYITRAEDFSILAKAR